MKFRLFAPSMEEKLAELLSESVSVLEAKLRQRAIGAIAERLAAELSASSSSAAALISGLLRCVETTMGEVDRLSSALSSVVVACQSAATPVEQREILAAHLNARASSRLQASGDLASLKRWMDLEAIQERYAIELADRIDEIEIAYHAATGQAERLKAEDAARLLRDGGGVSYPMKHAAPGRPPVVRLSALRALGAFLSKVEASERLLWLGVENSRLISNWAGGTDAPRWVQVASMEISALVFPATVHDLLAERLGERDGKESFILRRNALRILGTLEKEDPTADLPISYRLFSKPAGLGRDNRLTTAVLARDDPSEHVRQELARFLAGHETKDALELLVALIREDASPRVRGVALRELTRRAMSDPDAVEKIETLVADILTQPDAPVVVRVALESIQKLATGTVRMCMPRVFVQPLMALANREGASPELSEAAAATLRLLEVESLPRLVSLRDRFHEALGKLGEGQKAHFDVPRRTRRRDLERALAMAARGDMTVSLRRVRSDRYVLTRGEPRRWRAWRMLQELRTPMPDKRKGYVHTRARIPAGEIVVPPVGMAEVTPTRVPGERQLCPPVGGWGAFLPRIDDLLAVTAVRSKPLRLITAAGTILVRGPDTVWKRMQARALLSLRYERYALMRQRSLASKEPREKRIYWQTVAAMGFSVEIADTDGEIQSEEFSIRPLLPQAFYSALPFTLPASIENILSYLLSPAGNAPSHLGLIVLVIYMWLVLKSALNMRGIERARKAIPLTIGGWGTRGKSGSERLKAALFHALRYDVLVKTTGCEAMFIHAMRDLPAQEIFIYRPYDKATIWEQKNVLYTARDLKAQVFLWECMALQPRFVETLASEWMKDEITTLTNAYPDHEDIQGPGGEDVARVIARFMPPKGITFTTEEQMLPLLQDAAREKKTSLKVVPPIEADLLPLDLLARLPYQEHPRNVALVLELAAHFGIDREFALVEIADHVILDLGVLKTYPTVSHRGRALTFSNGMSANERAGFLSNWTRLGFDNHNIDKTPERVTVSIVNNRADRVARSRVFAQIFVDDVGVDHIVLINSNLGGMMQFIGEALENWLRDTRISGAGSTDEALQGFDEQMRRVGVRAADSALEDGILRMLCALPMDEMDAVNILEKLTPLLKGSPEALGEAMEKALADKAVPEGADDIRADIVRHTARLARRLSVRRKAREQVKQALDRGAPAEADEAFRNAYRTLFLDRIGVLWNSGATGDQVIDFMTREIPPGADARVMGTQNIKGTGLDFVYRWLSIDRVRGAIEKMQSTPSARAETITWMMSYSDFGLIDCRESLALLLDVKDRPDWAEHKKLLGAAIERLKALEREKVTKLVDVGRAGLGVRMLGHVEQLFDHLDSVRRTGWAGTVMRDLYDRRVGHGRAAILLRDIVGRQKGGWMAKDLAKWYGRWQERLSGLDRGRRADEKKKDSTPADELPMATDKA